MVPIEFSQSNVKFTAPGCLPLPAFTDGKYIVSCWQLTDEEQRAIADNGKIWLAVMVPVQPPVAISTDCPIKTENDTWPEELA